MRFLIPAIALCLALLPLAGGFALAQSNQQAAPAKASPAAPQAATASAIGESDAAKHAKRTACLKEAKAKKLLGPEKTAFIKNCVAAP